MILSAQLGKAHGFLHTHKRLAASLNSWPGGRAPTPVENDSNHREPKEFWMTSLVGVCAVSVSTLQKELGESEARRNLS